MVSILTSKGQTTVPKAIREALGVHIGEPMDWQIEGGTVRVARMRRADEVPTIKLRRVNGKLLLPDNVELTDEAILRAIRADRDSR